MRHLILILFFAFISCKETEVSPLAKFTGAFKYQDRHFVFTEQSGALHVKIDGVDYGIASVYNDTFGAGKDGNILIVEIKNGALEITLLEGNVVTQGVLVRE